MPLWVTVGVHPGGGQSTLAEEARIVKYYVWQGAGVHCLPNPEYQEGLSSLEHVRPPFGDLQKKEAYFTR